MILPINYSYLIYNTYHVILRKKFASIHEFLFTVTCHLCKGEKVRKVERKLVRLETIGIVSFHRLSALRTNSLGQAFVTLCGSKNQFNNWERSRTTDRLSTPAWWRHATLFSATPTHLPRLKIRTATAEQAKWWPTNEIGLFALLQ